MKANVNQNTAMVAAVVVLGVVAARFLVHPLHARADAVHAAHALLENRVTNWQGPDAILEPLREELSHRNEIVQIEQRPLPSTPDLAGLIRRLSLEIDGFRVIDQTFVAGRRGLAATAAPESWKCVPLTMELVSDYSSMRTLINRIESNPDPVRITRLTVERMNDQNGEKGIAHTTLVLDVIFRSEEASP